MAPFTSLPHLPRIALDLLFPPRCAGCGREGSLLCAACFRTFPRLTEPACDRCGLPLPCSGASCGDCVARPLPLEGLRSLWAMEGMARQAVLQLKYGNLRGLSGRLGAAMAAELQRWGPPVEVVVPVPLHPRRLRERGYNQAELLAEAIAEVVGLPLTQALRRVRPTASQVRSASREERWINLVGAFTLAAADSVRGKRFLLVDDVATTGATVASCAQTLLDGGAAGVWALTATRET